MNSQPDQHLQARKQVLGACVHPAACGAEIAGNPYGADVSPLITVSLRNVTFRLIALRLFGMTLNLPSVATTLTAEDMS